MVQRHRLEVGATTKPMQILGELTDYGELGE